MFLRFKIRGASDDVKAAVLSKDGFTECLKEDEEDSYRFKVLEHTQVVVCPDEDGGRTNTASSPCRSEDRRSPALSGAAPVFSRR
ncbi:hypothetical protein NE577_15985, partial [Cloacibacillus evryensis]